MAEIWKPFPRNAGYTVSSHGRVIGPRGKILKTKIDRHGYKAFNCTVNKKHTTVKVCIAVLESHIGYKKHKKLVCRHLDDDKQNDCLENLCWGTQKENCQDRKDNASALFGERSPHAKLTEKQVLSIRTQFSQGKTVKFLLKKFNVSETLIRLIINKKAWKHI